MNNVFTFVDIFVTYIYILYNKHYIFQKNNQKKKWILNMVIIHHK